MGTRRVRRSDADLGWYTSTSARKGLLPRCPFASVYRCPRYYQSLSLLGEAGSTKLNPGEDRLLREQWERSDLWPVTDEQATWTSGPPGNPGIFSNFCPEVSFERFGMFASDFSTYTDEIDASLAHARLARRGTAAERWRSAWAHVAPMHYSECPLYSPLQAAGPLLKPLGPIGFVRE